MREMFNLAGCLDFQFLLFTLEISELTAERNHSRASEIWRGGRALDFNEARLEIILISFIKIDYVCYQVRVSD